MKKSILIIGTVVIASSLTAFAYTNWQGDKATTPTVSKSTNSSSENKCAKHNESASLKEKNKPFRYDVDVRFNSTVLLDELQNATDVSTLIPNYPADEIVSIQKTEVCLFTEDGKIILDGTSSKMNSKQLNLLQKATISSDFYIQVFYKKKNVKTGALEDEYLIYYMTVAPETEASYKGGHDALINYLKEGSKDETKNVEYSSLRPGKVRFLITEKGDIANVELESSSGHGVIDTRMIQLITDMPSWTPAKNKKSEPVDQELVFFFGVMGC